MRSNDPGFVVVSSLWLLLALLPLRAASAEDPAVGQWLAVEADGATATIELYLRDGLLFGRAIERLDPKGQPLHETCGGCKGELRGKPIEQIEFLHHLRKEGPRWVGRIIDTRPGMTEGVEASCDLEVTGDTLALHGYMGLRMLGQTRKWRRKRSAEEAHS